MKYLIFCLALLCVAPCAFAQGDYEQKDGKQASEATEGAANDGPVTRISQDFRGKIMLGYSAVFVLIIGYLIYSHRRNAGLADEADFLKRRLDDLQRQD